MLVLAVVYHLQPGGIKGWPMCKPTLPPVWPPTGILPGGFADLWVPVVARDQPGRLSFLGPVRPLAGTGNNDREQTEGLVDGLLLKKPIGLHNEL